MEPTKRAPKKAKVAAEDPDRPSKEPDQPREEGEMEEMQEDPAYTDYSTVPAPHRDRLLAERGNLLLELTIENTRILRNTLDTLSQLVLDTNVYFDDTGFTIAAMDPSAICMVYFKMYADKMHKYACAQSMNIGLSLASLMKVLKTCKQDCVLSMYHWEQYRNFLTVHLLSKNGTERSFDLITLDIEQEDLVMPEDTEYTHILQIPAEDLHREMLGISLVGAQDVTFYMGKEGLQLKFASDICESGCVAIATSNAAEGIDEPVELDFKVKYVEKFTKISSLAEFAQVLLKKDFPMTLRFNLRDTGEIRWYIAPVMT